jgi:hypothetical protein
VIHADWDPLDEDSPYPEVRASVSNLDDRDMPGESPLPSTPYGLAYTQSLQCGQGSWDSFLSSFVPS